MALAANALTTLATAQGEVSGLSTAGTAVGERLIAVASDAIEHYCARKFAKLSRTERYRPPRGTLLVVNVRPVDSSVDVTATLDGVALGDIVVDDPDAGVLYLAGGWGGASYELAYPGSVSGHPIPGSARRVLAVTYTAGFVLPKDESAGPPAVVRTLPQDIEQACIDTVASLFRRRGIDQAAAAFDTGNELIGRGVGGVLPGPVRAMLAPFRSRVI
jgi:hypothetical protein